MRRVQYICAWCKKPLPQDGTVDLCGGEYTETDSEGREVGPVSHGICGPCAAKLEAEIEEQDEPDERACEAWYKKMEQQGGTK